MGLTSIEWCRYTYNRWIGCANAWRDLPSAALLNMNPPEGFPTAEECRNCYAADADQRHLYEGEGHWGAGAPRYVTTPDYHHMPFGWNKTAKRKGDRPRCFGGSNMDFADAEPPPGEPAGLWDVIKQTDALDWLMLTKRPERLPVVLPWMLDGSPSWKHVWVGTSVGHPDSYWRIDKLMAARAALRFLSVEPLLAELDLSRWVFNRRRAIRDAMHGPAAYNEDQADSVIAYPVDWVIVGGESGRAARECEIDWIRSIVKQCRDASVPVFVKQLGKRPVLVENCITCRGVGERRSPLDGSMYRCDDCGGSGNDRTIIRLTKKGGDMLEWPEDLRNIRELPISPATRAA